MCNLCYCKCYEIVFDRNCGKRDEASLVGLYPKEILGLGKQSFWTENQMMDLYCFNLDQSMKSMCN